MKSSIQFVVGIILGATAHAFAPSQLLSRGLTANTPSARHGRALRASADEHVQQLRLEGEARIAAKQEINQAYHELKARLKGLDDDDAAAAIFQSEASARIEQLRSEGAARLEAREKMTSAYMVRENNDQGLYRALFTCAIQVVTILIGFRLCTSVSVKHGTSGFFQTLVLLDLHVIVNLFSIKPEDLNNNSSFSLLCV